jgi:hypothetical protein
MGGWWEFGGGVNGSTLGILVGLMFHFMITTIYFKHVSTKTLLEVWVQCVDDCKNYPYEICWTTCTWNATC